MDSSLLLQFAQHIYSQHNIPNRFDNSRSDDIYHRVMPPSSFVRSSASRSDMQDQPVYIKTPYNSSSVFSESSASSNSSSDSACSSLNSSSADPMADYPSKPEYDVSARVPSLTGSDYAMGRTFSGSSWASFDRQVQTPTDYYPSYNEMQSTPMSHHSNDMSGILVQQYAAASQPSEDASYPAPLQDFAAISTFYDNTSSSEQNLASLAHISGQPALPPYSSPSDLAPVDPNPSVSYGFHSSPFHAHAQAQPFVSMDDIRASYGSYGTAQSSSSSSDSYNSPRSLQYPESSPETHPHGINLQEISPSPTISPDVIFAELPNSQTTLEACDPRFTVADGPGTSASAADLEMDETSSPAEGRRRRGRGRPPTNRSIKRQRKVSSSSSSSADASGDSEREDDADQGDDGDDDEYVLRGNSRPSRTRRRTARAQSAESMPASFSPLLSTRKLAPPVPVPNLTKKSRGRRVPTSAAVVSQNGVQKNNRGYMCKVPGCGKCFARGEHLKRHVRSIHTNEKPHKCPYPGCGKDFSRHDNLGQHMRVHKNFPSKMGFKDGSSPPGDDSA